jgi:hypothetical protein
LLLAVLVGLVFLGLRCPAGADAFLAGAGDCAWSLVVLWWFMAGQRKGC